MPLQLSIPFYTAIAAYLAAAMLAIRFARGAGERSLFFAKRAAGIGNTLLLLVFIYRWAKWGLVPLTGMGDSLNLFLILCTGIILSIQRNDAMRPLTCFYFPALAMLAIVSAIVAPQHLGEQPRELNGILVSVHVGLVFLSFSLFFVASLTSMAYAVKAQQLKRHNTTGFSETPLA